MTAVDARAPTEAESHIGQLRRLMRLVADHLEEGGSPAVAAMNLRVGAGARWARDVAMACEIVGRKPRPARKSRAWRP